MMLPEAAEAHLAWLRTRLADYGADVRARLLAGLLLPVDRLRDRAARPALAATSCGRSSSASTCSSPRRCRSSRR